MTNTEITPELLRDVANWIDGTGHGLGPGAALRDEADRIEREQSDEKRIDELAQVGFNAEAACAAKLSGHDILSWEESTPLQRNVTRAGIRAVLAHLEQERETDGYCTCHPAERGRTADCGMRAHRKAALLYANAAAAVHPRTWNELRDIPDDVKVVRDPKGIEWHRTPSGDWALDASTWMPGCENSPFTEVIADA